MEDHLHLLDLVVVPVFALRGKRHSGRRAWSVVGQRREELEVEHGSDDEQKDQNNHEEHPDLAPERHEASLHGQRVALLLCAKSRSVAFTRKQKS
jgi:hypothetical protein